MINCAGLRDEYIYHLMLTTQEVLLLSYQQAHRLYARLGEEGKLPTEQLISLGQLLETWQANSKVDETLNQLEESTQLIMDEMDYLTGPPTPPLPTSCKDCGKSFTLIQSAFAFEGRCEVCYAKVHEPKCSRCGRPTDYQYNGKPTCPGCMAKQVGIGKEKPKEVNID
jgi:DNA-directed RNA polymerase subunit RPC12/RpoP